VAPVAQRQRQTT